MKKTKIKNQKPIDIDVHFKYRCPKCCIEHWISLKEAKTKNFKVVCDCSKVFIPKRIDKIKIMYVSSERHKSNIVSNAENTDDPKTTIGNSEIDNNLLNKCSTILIGYGFTDAESKDLIKKTYSTNPSEDAGLLIKLALKSLGGCKL